MPRTKRPVSKPEKLIEPSEKGESKGEVLKRFDKLVADKLKKIEARAAMETRSIELDFKLLIGSINAKHLQMTVGQLKNELNLLEVPSNRKTDKSDDGYMTENSSHGSGDAKKTKLAPPSSTNSSRRTSRRSRSADASCRAKPPASAARAATSRRRSKSVFKTPAYKNVNCPPITPKVAPQTPMTLLRQPRHGEMVVSMQGSPVMVPTYSRQQDEKVNCDIVLADGTVLSLKPRELRQSQAHIPFSLMEPSVFSQIRTLKENLDKVMKLGQKHVMKWCNDDH